MSLVRSLFPSFFRKKQSSYAGKKKLSLLGRKNGTLIRTIVTRISLSFKRRHHTLSRSVFKRKWRNTTQTSRKALKVRELFFWFARAGSESEISLSLSLSSPFFFFERRRRRRRSFFVSDGLSLSLITTTKNADLFTGALSYENKFSLDAKPISGGVRFFSSHRFQPCSSFVFLLSLSLFLSDERERERSKMDSFVFPKRFFVIALERKERASRFPLSLSLFFVVGRKRLTARARSLLTLLKKQTTKNKTTRENSPSLRRLKAPTARPGR